VQSFPILGSPLDISEPNPNESISRKPKHNKKILIFSRKPGKNHPKKTVLDLAKNKKILILSTKSGKNHPKKWVQNLAKNKM
jgi:hypothetical protein